MSTTNGRVVGVNGNMITVEFNAAVSQNEVAFARLGDMRLMAEVVRVRGTRADLQVFEDTTGLAVGDPVEFTGGLLSVELGPGLLSQVYDGLQNPLPELAEKCGFFLQRGTYLDALPRDTEWDFTPRVEVGATVTAGEALGRPQAMLGEGIADRAFQQQALVLQRRECRVHRPGAQLPASFPALDDLGDRPPLVEGAGRDRRRRSLEVDVARTGAILDRPRDGRAPIHCHAVGDGVDEGPGRGRRPDAHVVGRPFDEGQVAAARECVGADADEVEAQLRRPKVDGAGEGVVDDGRNTAGAGQIGNLEAFEAVLPPAEQLTDAACLEVEGGGERLAGLVGRPLRDFIVPTGDGSMPVFTIPGFLSGEYNLKRLNRFLTTHGFPAGSWGRGRNLGPRDKTLFAGRTVPGQPRMVTFTVEITGREAVDGTARVLSTRGGVLEGRFRLIPGLEN